MTKGAEHDVSGKKDQSTAAGETEARGPPVQKDSDSDTAESIINTMTTGAGHDDSEGKDESTIAGQTEASSDTEQEDPETVDMFDFDLSKIKFPPELPRLAADRNPQIPGQPGRPYRKLNMALRAAGERSSFIRDFVRAHDRIMAGEVEWQGEVTVSAVNSQPSPLPRSLGTPGWRHFWDSRTSAYLGINDFNYYINGPGRREQDPAYQAHAQYGRPIMGLWSDICYSYFSALTTSTGEIMWRTNGWTNSEPANDVEAHYLDLVKVKPYDRSPDGWPPTKRERDYLWVLCQRATEDTPAGWRNVIWEATERLQSKHPNHQVFLIIAIGVKCMLFLWDPLMPTNEGCNNSPPRLQILSDNGVEVWPIDAMIKLVHEEEPWVDMATGFLNIGQAYHLDCRTVIPADDSPGAGDLKYEEDMANIENFLIAIRNGPIRDMKRFEHQDYF